MRTVMIAIVGGLIAAGFAAGTTAAASAAPSIVPTPGSQIVLDAPSGETWFCLLGTTGPTPYSGVRDETIVGGTAPVWTVWFPGQDVHIGCVSSTVPFVLYRGLRVANGLHPLPQ